MYIISPNPVPEGYYRYAVVNSAKTSIMFFDTLEELPDYIEYLSTYQQRRIVEGDWELGFKGSIADFMELPQIEILYTSESHPELFI